MKKSTLVLAIASVLALPSSAQSFNTDAEASVKADAQMQASGNRETSEPAGEQEQQNPPASSYPSMSMNAQGDARGSAAVRTQPEDSSTQEESADIDNGVSGTGESANETAGETADGTTTLAGESRSLLEAGAEHSGNAAASLSQSAQGQARAGADAGLTTAISVRDEAEDRVEQGQGAAEAAARSGTDTAAQVRTRSEAQAASVVESASVAANTGAEVAAEVSQTVSNEVSNSVSAAAATAVNAEVAQQVSATVADQVASEVTGAAEASVNQALNANITR